jgi:hypothetical protein
MDEFVISMSYTHLNADAQILIREAKKIQTQSRTDNNYHLPIDRGQENKESFLVLLFVTSSFSQAELNPISAYDIQILQPTQIMNNRK